MPHSQTAAFTMTLGPFTSTLRVNSVRRMVRGFPHLIRVLVRDPLFQQRIDRLSVLVGEAACANATESLSSKESTTEFTAVNTSGSVRLSRSATGAV
nr:hypothetical protein [Amycolatopsis sp. MJM2582]